MTCLLVLCCIFSVVFLALTIKRCLQITSLFQERDDEIQSLNLPFVAAHILMLVVQTISILIWPISQSEQGVSWYRLDMFYQVYFGLVDILLCFIINLLIEDNKQFDLNQSGGKWVEESSEDHFGLIK